MSRMPLCLAACLTLWGCAAPPPAPAQAPSPAPAPTSFTYDKSVVAGVRYKLDFYVSLHADCSSVGYTVVRVTTPPAHGSLTVEQGPDYPAYNKDNQRYECNLKPAPGTLLWYQSEPNYHGPDSLTVEAIFPSATARTSTFKLMVK